MAISTTLPEVKQDLAVLKSIMENQIALCERIKTVFTLKQKLLLEWQTEELSGTVELEEKLMSEMEHLESGRRDAVIKLADSLGLDGEVTLNELTELAGSPSDQQLLELGDELFKKARELSELNTSNAFLARNIVEYTALVLRLFTQESHKMNYDSRGSVQNEGIRRNILNTKV